MIAVCVIAVIAIVALACIVQLQERSHQEAREQWAAERRELCNRIQRPEAIPMVSASFEVPEQAPDEWNLVGTIRHDPEGE